MKNKYLEYVIDYKGKDISFYQFQEDIKFAKNIIVQHFNTVAENKKFAELMMEKFKLTEFPEGYHKGEWIVFDFGDTIVHSFVQDKREKYNLDKLWQSLRVNVLQSTKKIKK